MTKKSLFLAIFVISTVSARSSIAAEAAAAVDKNGKELASKAKPATTAKTINVTGAAKGKATTVKAAAEKAPEKNAKSIIKSIKRMPASALVPPPPPDTPTLMGLPEGDYDSLANLEYMSLSALKERQKQLNSQLLDAQEELKTKQTDAEEIKSKATQFETLYTEGVISKHELEVTKKDASEVDARISRAKMRVEDLQSNISRLNARLTEQERRLAKVKKNSLASKNKLAITKKNEPKAADKAPIEVDKAQEKTRDQI